MMSAVHNHAERKRAVAAVSPQSPNTPSVENEQAEATKSPVAGFGANEWLVDEIYQQYLQDPNSVDRAWWDFFADYKPGGSTTASGEDAARPAAPQPQQPAAAPTRWTCGPSRSGTRTCPSRAPSCWPAGSTWSRG